MTRRLARDRANPAPRSRSRFRWTDASVLLVATALGVAMGREVYLLMTDPGIIMISHAEPRSFPLWRRVLIPILVCWTLALAPIPMLRPRTRLRRLTRSPGFSAVLVVAVLAARALADTQLWKVVNHWLGTNPFGPWRFSLLGTIQAYPSWLVSGADSAGFTIALVWACLAMSRWWRPDPGWIDRAGRVLGCAWIAMSAASCCERAMS